jgi:hypothetical protein
MVKLILLLFLTVSVTLAQKINPHLKDIEKELKKAHDDTSWANRTIRNRIMNEQVLPHI